MEFLGIGGHFVVYLRYEIVIERRGIIFIINVRGNSRENTPTRNQTGLFASPRSLRN